MPYEVVSGELPARASHLDALTDRLDTAVSAAEEVSMSDEAYGLLCSFLLPVVNPMEEKGMEALNAAREGVEITAENVRTTATRPRHPRRTRCHPRRSQPPPVERVDRVHQRQDRPAHPYGLRLQTPRSTHLPSPTRPRRLPTRATRPNPHVDPKSLIRPEVWLRPPSPGTSRSFLGSRARRGRPGAGAATVPLPFTP